MMYCLRSYIPFLLLPLPLSLSPVHLTILLAVTYILNRPCIYCSILLLILFASSCQWSGRCFVDLSEQINGQQGTNGIVNWFIPRIYTLDNNIISGNTTTTMTNLTMGDQSVVEFLQEVVNTTAVALADAAMQGLKSKVNGSSALLQNARSWDETRIGLEWLKKLLGRSEWTLPCTQFKIVLG